MTDDLMAPEVILWTDPQRAALATRLLQAMENDIRLIGVGGPRGGDTVELCQAYGLSPLDDLRQLLVECPANYLLLASVRGVDPKLLHLALQQGMTILALEPTSAGFDQIVPTKAAQGDGRLFGIPSFMLSPAWIKAGETHDILGPIRLISFESVGPAADQSLHARLAEAWQVVSRFAGVPESIDCSLVGPLSEIPEDPRLVAGHLAAHARLPRGGTAQITLSDQCRTTSRRLHVIGDQGRLLMTDLTYQLFGEDGQQLEEAALDLPATGPEASRTTFIQLAAAQWRRLIHHPDQTPWHLPSTQDQANNLGCQLASLLSARTNQPENPVRMASLVQM
jgi:hypothetical protein